MCPTTSWLCMLYLRLDFSFLRSCGWSLFCRHKELKRPGCVTWIRKQMWELGRGGHLTPNSSATVLHAKLGTAVLCIRRLVHNSVLSAHSLRRSHQKYAASQYASIMPRWSLPVSHPVLARLWKYNLDLPPFQMFCSENISLVFHS